MATMFKIIYNRPLGDARGSGLIRQLLDLVIVELAKRRPDLEMRSRMIALTQKRSSAKMRQLREKDRPTIGCVIALV
jgi:hypothetical protein